MERPLSATSPCRDDDGTRDRHDSQPVGGDGGTGGVGDEVSREKVAGGARERGGGGSGDGEGDDGWEGWD